ncbi:MAG: HEAT repeat domain-containing protein [Phycisphaerales bacterium]|nr:HEAT repeat domain-containing protein [Phycisphaerales bacterium]
MKKYTFSNSAHSISSGVGIVFLTLSTIAGCGAEIRPDGPRQIIYKQSDGSSRIVQVAPATELRELAIDRLMRLTTDPSPEIRANAIEALATVTSRVEPIVALALSDPNDGVRTVATMVAGQSNLSSLAPTIRELLTDKSPFVRSAAIYAMGTFGEKVDQTDLARYLFESTNTGMRSQAAFILGELGESSAIPMLIQAISEPMPSATPNEKKIFRLQVAEALFKLGHDQSIDTIRSALYPSRKEELEATALAVQIIGQIKDRPSMDQLIYLADNQGDNVMPAEVRLGVASALANMGHREGSFVADEYLDNALDTIRAQSAAVYGKTSDIGNLGKLEMMMLNDPSPLAQVAAAGAIVDYTRREMIRSSAQ